MKKLGMTLLLALVTIGSPALTDLAHAQNDGGHEEERSDRGRGRRQFGFGPRGREAGILGLLGVEEVQKEIQLTEDQLAALEAFRGEAEAGRPEFPGNFREMTEEERAEFRKSMEEWASKQNESAKQVLTTLLEPEQFERLTQISLQQQGVSALNDKTVADKLGLTEKQRTDIAAAIEENQATLRSEMRTAFQGGQAGSDREALRKKVEELRTISEKEILGKLTVDQKSIFAAMQGETFEMPPRLPGMRGAGFRGRGRRNRSDDRE